MVAPSQTLQFQAETKQLLELMVHSLYTTKDIFLRELISNASDALDRLRYEELMQPSLLDGSDKQIRSEIDPAARTLTVSDNGIGMNREEVIANIGTIAKSGTRELRERLKEGATNEQLSQLIGQFGVGFYSAFMVADKVTLVTRRADETVATQWESGGEGQYSIVEMEKEGHGTSVTLHLKPSDPDNGIEDYLDKWVLSRIVRRYSDFVTYPIVLVGHAESDSVNVQGEPSPETKKTEDKILNTMKPLWARARSEKLGREEESQRVAEELKQQEEAVAGLLELIQRQLDATVKQVRLTNRLTTSPACLVAGAEHDDSPFLERLLQRGKGGGPRQRRILELNPQHAIFKKMEERYRHDANDPLLPQCAGLLLGYAFLAEGSELPDSIDFTRLTVSMMEQML